MASLAARTATAACTPRPADGVRTRQHTLLSLVASCSASGSSSSSRISLPLARRGERRQPRAWRVPRAASGAGEATVANPPGDEASKQFALAIAKVADDTKCTDIVVLDVAPVVSWTSFLVVATVFSKPQLLATLARVEKAAAASHGRVRRNLPGSSPWESLDFGDVVLHLFTAEQRDYYDIESFYAAAEEVELPFGPDAAGAAAAPTWSTRA